LQVLRFTSESGFWTNEIKFISRRAKSMLEFAEEVRKTALLLVG